MLPSWLNHHLLQGLFSKHFPILLSSMFAILYRANVVYVLLYPSLPHSPIYGDTLKYGETTRRWNGGDSLVTMQPALSGYSSYT
ncbi:hypothetical protein H5410_013293 [Solanum commersonii]|uniref:Uncharacterized protein n=1 Tax=Solanum commersonii TaxID=4109 RepID=A0A9J6AUY3_SOLCO|nr:hypothetical protein H5410_013293 [Solanum commersonii]